MCYFCDGNKPSFQESKSSILQLRQAIYDQDSFLINASRADALRFGNSFEWSQDLLTEQVSMSIVCNPDTDKGLLLFVLGCWLDLQKPYTQVWTSLLLQTDKWLDNHAWQDVETELPRGSFQQTKPHLLKTIRTLRMYQKSFAAWFTKTVLSIVVENGAQRGNLYRFVSKVCEDLYSATSKPFQKAIGSGWLSDSYQDEHYKRLWMFVMFLRRDTFAIRCLLKRSLESLPQGQEAFHYWIDDTYFDPTECELPVDSRVLAHWNNLGFAVSPQTDNRRVAMEARKLARAHSVSPASFDAILFF